LTSNFPTLYKTPQPYLTTTDKHTTIVCLLLLLLLLPILLLLPLLSSRLLLLLLLLHCFCPTTAALVPPLPASSATPAAPTLTQLQFLQTSLHAFPEPFTYPIYSQLPCLPSPFHTQLNSNCVQT
jgi:hypothetical protein